VLLGTLLPSARAAQAIGLLLFFPSFLLGVGGPPPEAMSESLRAVADVLPLALFVVAGLAMTRHSISVVLPVALAVIGLGVVLAWRRLSGWPLAAGLVIATAGIVAMAHGQSSNLGWFSVCVLAGWGALVCVPRVAVTLGGIQIATFVGEWFAQTEEPGWGAWIAGTTFTMVACILARRQRLLVVQLAQAQAGLADRARAEERNRIAGEMHDVIGHALTVSLLHVSSARLSLEDDDPAEAKASLAEAERLAQQSLAEVRAAVGLMRDHDPSTLAPMPEAGDVVELVESFRRAGATVELVVDGDLAALGATRGLAVYRIVQEALTNAVRHAPGSRVSVRIETGRGATTVTVASTGTPDPDAREGSGLLGMRERAEALGGRLRAGAWQGGWRIEAVLPS
ncbi:MAG: histidine kinase, partial [Actinomycetota bacterium]|nr:histidine kinase [Actinomycetota bacterium]